MILLVLSRRSFACPTAVWLACCAVPLCPSMWEGKRGLCTDLFPYLTLPDSTTGSSKRRSAKARVRSTANHPV